MKDLRADIPDAGKILLHNVYGWFDRAERGIYVLTDAGHAALQAVAAATAGPERHGTITTGIIRPG